MEVEQSSRPDSKPLRNILWLQAEQNFVSLITLHLPSILKIHSIGTWLFNLSKITFIIYKPWHLPEKSSGPQLGYSSRSVTRCISFENRSPPSQAETQTNSALNKKLKFVSFSYNKLTDVSHQTMHQYWISIIHILLSTYNKICKGGKETFYSSPLTRLTNAGKNTISMKLARENISAMFSKGNTHEWADSKSRTCSKLLSKKASFVSDTKHNFFYMKNTKIKVQVLQRWKT